ncbi:hypothetical protein M0804_014131 [Polistes exclamans]|nr:hypothetical protein M0804_014131 [Polistes exclamans]
MWTGLLKFSSVSAAILGLIVIFKFIKLIIDTVLRGYALHTVYRWSVLLIEANWGSLTNLLLHMKNAKSGKGKRPQAEAAELKEITTGQPGDKGDTKDNAHASTEASASQTDTPSKHVRFAWGNEVIIRFDALRST